MPNEKRPSGFAALAALRDQMSAAPAQTPRATPVGVDIRPKGPARAVVRLERKQRRGKEVTVIEKLALPPAELAAWCVKLKQALGCGGAVEGDAIVVQGDFRARLPDVLTKLGVRAVTVSGT